jgi:hypothetical protein
MALRLPGIRVTRGYYHAFRFRREENRDLIYSKSCIPGREKCSLRAVMPAYNYFRWMVCAMCACPYRAGIF